MYLHMPCVLFIIINRTEFNRSQCFFVVTDSELYNPYSVLVRLLKSDVILNSNIDSPRCGDFDFLSDISVMKTCKNISVQL